MSMRTGNADQNQPQLFDLTSLASGPFIYAIIGGICVIIWAIISGWPGPINATSYEQERLDTALPAPVPEQSITLDFVMEHNGFNSLEVVVVNFDPGNSANQATAVISLVDNFGEIVASTRLQNSTTTHNQVVRLDFEPIPNSGSKSYKLFMVGEDGNQLSLWGYSLNVWPKSSLDGGGTAQTLNMKLGYAFRWQSVFSVLGNLLGRFWIVLLTALLYIPLPGALFMKMWPKAYQDQPIIRLALIFGLGVALWPLIWQWITVIGLSFSPLILIVVIVIGWLFIILTSDFDLFTTLSRPTRETGLMILALFAVFLIRLLAVRDMAFLPWVDSSRHALITAIMRDSGQFLTTYEPYLPVSWTGYHYGFHTLSAGIGLIVGDRANLPDQLLTLMQLLSTLTSLSVFGAAWLMTKKRSIGWIAAFMLALPFLFPGYYATWGRLTQISGLIVLPLLVGYLMAEPEDGGSTNQNSGWNWNLILIGTILTAGLFLLHARVFFYFIPFGLVLAVYHIYQWVSASEGESYDFNQLIRGRLGHLAIIAIASALLVAPRIWALLSETTYVGVGVVTETTGRPLLDFPVGYVTAGWERWFWLMAALSIPLAFAYKYLQTNSVTAGRLHDEGNVWTRVTLILGGWLGLLYLATAGPSLHPNWPILLPQSSINSAYIATFATEAILIGIAVYLLYKVSANIHRLAGYLVMALIGAGLIASGIFGVRNQVAILNESTILGQQADLAAIEWMADNTPTNAKIANNSWLWLGTTWAGTDGAAWLTPMTGRLSGTPPIDHIYNSRLFGITSAFNQSASDIDDWSSPAALDLLKQNNFDYVFTGVSDGSGGVDMDPAELLRNPGVEVVYSADGVFVFRIIEQ